MSHICGTVEAVIPSIQIGPDTGDAQTSPNTWLHDFSYLTDGTKFVILHFTNVLLPASNRLEVELGYDIDVFTSADGSTFWTRPINIHQLAGNTIPIRYITDGSNSGSATVEEYGRSQSLQSFSPGHNSITNCDPFLPGVWDEPDFPHIPGSTDPKYDPFWICDEFNPPDWVNARCAGLGTVQRDVARSCGMIVTVHQGDSGHPDDYVSTCSVTLIDSDLVVLAGHCVSNHPFEVPTSSITFDYEVNCDGSVDIGYDAVFYKVIGLVKYRYSDGRDYAILQIRGAPPLPPVPVKNGYPAVGESVFGIHHPNGAVKKVSPASLTGSVSSTGSTIGTNLDVAGGSSGSGLFDLNGRFLGTLSYGGPCSLNYSSGAVMLDDPILVPDPPTERAVMLVLDRSGSMSGPALDGGSKIDEARDAAELFISMMRASMGNQAGLVSFASNASSPLEESLDLLDESKRSDLLAELPGITPNGRTSIGDGLISARNELNGTSGIPRSILLLTDGMENEPQLIDDVSGLGSTEITAIGFGTESNLDGPRLTDLAQTHGGYYKRAGTGLELRKFFALAFGDIFEAGALADPQLHLSDSMREGPAVPFNVCGEEAVTVVVGWDDPNAQILLDVRTPTGQLLDLSSGGIETDAGKTWLFARIPLPQNGERNGKWTANVRRPTDSSEFPPPAIPVDYFINVIARGGPSLRPFQQPRRLYTGDVLHPKVIFQYPDETVPQGAKVTIDIRRPDASTGTKLAQNGLGGTRIVDGDIIPAKQATLMQMEQTSGSPTVNYVDETHTMSDSSYHSGTFRPAGIFGIRLDNALVVEGTYTFHAKARIESTCVLTREVQWSHYVAVGIDPDHTTVTVVPANDGSGQVVVTFTPQDQYGNLVGPGSVDEFDIDPLPGCTIVGQVLDLGDGRYRVTLACDPDSDDTPGVVVTQPGRDPVVLVPGTTKVEHYRYVVPIHCGQPDDCCADCSPLAEGRYATSVTVFNGTEHDAVVGIAVIPTTFTGSPRGNWPDSSEIRVHDKTQLQSKTATTIDCCSIANLLFGPNSQGSTTLNSGMLVLESRKKLHISATYTMTDGRGKNASIDVEFVEPERYVNRERTIRPAVPDRVQTTETPRLPPPRPQDYPCLKPAKPKDKPKKSTRKTARKTVRKKKK